MGGKINFYLLEYTFTHILRYKFKNFFILVVMGLLIGLLASTFFIANGMKHEYNTLVDNYPDITITQQKGMRDTTMHNEDVLKLFTIAGVKSAVGRVWGKYYFSYVDKAFLLLAKEPFETYANPLLETTEPLEENFMSISVGVQKSLESSYYKEYFNFIKPDGDIKRVSIRDIFQGGNSLETSSAIIISKVDAQEIFDYKEDEITDISVDIANDEEIPLVAAKIQTLFPNARLDMKDDLRVKYENIYNLRSGFFLSIFIITFFTFFIIIYDKVNGLNSEQKREIGILKALGWRINDVLRTKLYEGLMISFFSYIMGVSLAFIYVYLFDAPFLKRIFVNNYDLLGDFPLHMSVDYNTLALLFFLSVPIYITATIIPAWRVATLDADEVMR